jgi:NADH-quinone oxidoreductase subunit A
MPSLLLYVLLFLAASTGLAVALLLLGGRFGPRRQGRVKEMPYESGMNPIHDARRRFDVRFHLVAIAFLVFDVELLFLYPWAVANKAPLPVRQFSVGLVFAEVMVFVTLLTVGFVYAWRKGVFRWR